MSLHPEIYFPQVKNLELIAKQVVKGYIIGKHKSPKYGFAVEFAEHNQYTPGDPLRHIDWKLYAKTNKLYTKRYEQETNMTAYIGLDLSSSMTFSENEDQLSKLEYALIAASSFLYVLQKQIDAAGLSLFQDEIIEHFPAKSNPRHFQNLRNTLENYIKYRPAYKKTNILSYLDYIAQRSGKNGMVILFTDMISEDIFSDDFQSQLKKLKFLGHEVLIFHLLDSKQEVHLDYENRPYEFVDVETGESIVTNPQSIQKVYQEAKKNEHQEIKKMLDSHKIAYHPIDIHDSFDKVLQPFFAARK